jgi:peptide/nickel transport system ATP-binding protein
LRVAANVCDLVAVMKSGKVVEFGETAHVFANPSHPYTQALVESIPGRDWNVAPH